MKVLQPEIKFLRKVSNLKEDAATYLKTCTAQTICRKGTNKLSPEYKRQIKVFGRDAYPFSSKHKKAKKAKTLLHLQLKTQLFQTSHQRN